MIIRVKSLKTISMHKPHHLISIFSITISKPLTEPHFLLLPYSYKSTFWWSWLTRYSLTSNGIWIRTAFAVIIHFQVSAIWQINLETIEKYHFFILLWYGWDIPFCTYQLEFDYGFIAWKSRSKWGTRLLSKSRKTVTFQIKNNLLFSYRSRPFFSF